MPELKLFDNGFYFEEGNFIDLLYVMNGSELEAAVERLYRDFQPNADNPSPNPLTGITRAIQQNQESLSERLRLTAYGDNEFIVTAQKIAPDSENYGVLLRICPDESGSIAGDEKIRRVAGMTSQDSGARFNQTYKRMGIKLVEAYGQLRNLTGNLTQEGILPNPLILSEDLGSDLSFDHESDPYSPHHIEIQIDDDFPETLFVPPSLRELGAQIFKYRLWDHFGSAHPLYGTRTWGLIDTLGGQVDGGFLEVITKEFPVLVYGESLIGDPDEKEDRCYKSVYIAAKAKILGTVEDTFAALAEIVLGGKRKHLAFTNDPRFAETNGFREKGCIAKLSMDLCKKRNWFSILRSKRL